MKGLMKGLWGVFIVWGVAAALATTMLVLFITHLFNGVAHCG